MPHTVSFVRPHISIQELETIVLPDFAVLTGINGSGKSHFLDGLSKGAFSSDSVQDHQSEILSFDGSQIAPVNSTEFSSALRQQEKDQRFEQINQQRKQFKKSIQKLVTQLGFPPATVISTDFLLHVQNTPNLREIHANLDTQQIGHGKFVSQLSIFARQLGAIVDQTLPMNASAARKATFEQNMFDIIFMSDAEVLEVSSWNWGRTEPFKQSFAQLFGTYRDLYGVNLRRVGAAASGHSDANPLSNEEFETMHRRPPWDIVNELLTAANLDFQISCPSLYDDHAFTPQLTKVSTGANVSFETLSSGEKVLMSFAICLFNGSDDRQETTFPKLLLLDEVDAPLHPSMVRGLLKTIKEVIVQKHHVKVIMTTHNPTTVALADEESLFEIATPRVNKISKDRALAILTDGVPTVAVSYGGRRQVFVESDTDAKLFSYLYEKYRHKLDSELSLSFIPVGIKKDSGEEINSGCDQVRKYVGELTNAGVRSIFGLIDWDGKNSSEGPLRVLCEDVRYSIENLLLDPVLLIPALASSNEADVMDKLDLEGDLSFLGISSWSQETWQVNVDKLTAFILGVQSEGDDTVKVEYLNGMSLKVPQKVLTMRGHDLESLLVEKFKFLIPYNRNGKKLTDFVCKTTLRQLSNLAPMEIISTFRMLLSKR
ncbi:AAA family ATPase [Parasedimentitalea psychrophila]|uniref:AAA family ATPase n=1 Tax=Parasedimentitalea psychrophila TaxID=2997337 RepID=A0A9Y2P1V2_9RHOB|nr:AAA family ATPase [Parasedimentitalea psychrophila]WIY25981.1 AAA family ATPase [Parasedimentitalea psychrophila]